MSESKLKEDSWLTKLSHFLLREPQDRHQLLSLLREAKQRELFNADALAMLEGVLQVSEMQVGNIMIPRDKMNTINANASSEENLEVIVSSSHSRFPVYNTSGEEIIGIVHAKDFLKLIVQKHPIQLSNIIRKPVFIPESKRLDVLLKEFRINRYHMAIIVDEFGSVAGLVTIEDVLEQIVGDIQDEFDDQEESTTREQTA